MTDQPIHPTFLVKRTRKSHAEAHLRPPRIDPEANARHIRATHRLRQAEGAATWGGQPTSQDLYVRSPAIRRVFAPLADRVLAKLNFTDLEGCFGTLPTTQLNLTDIARSVTLSRTPDERQRDMQVWTAHGQVSAPLDRIEPPQPGRVWCLATIPSETGAVDWLAVFLRTEDVPTFKNVLRVLWPIVRSSCYEEAIASPRVAIEDPLHDACDTLGGLGVLLLDRGARLLRCNGAARASLLSGAWLRCTPDGIVSPISGNARVLRDTVERMLTAESDPGEQILMVERLDMPDRLPLTLWRRRFQGSDLRYVVASAPIPPDRARIERIAVAKGLTKSEARVAALVQRGMSNRDAAEAAGLTEQTLATYVKRALSKLNLRSRSELISVLTWQSAGHRLD